MSEKPHRQLVVWQKSVEFAERVYAATRRFPVEERYALSSQIQRAAVSIPSNIAEGAARGSRRDYVRFLYTARASVSEIDTQLELARRLGYLSEVELPPLQDGLDELSKMLHGLILSLSR